MSRSNLARSRATAMSCQSSGLVQSYSLPVRGPDQPSRPNPAWGLKAQNHIKCIFVMAALALLRCALRGFRYSHVQTPLLGAEIARPQDTDPGAGRKGAAEVLSLSRRQPHPSATALALVTDTVFSVTIRIARALTHAGVSWTYGAGAASPAATPRRSMNIATTPACLPGLCLDAVIDGTQTGPRVRFDISEPAQQGARERVDRLIGDRCFIPVANGWTPPLRLSGFAPANFLCIGHIGAAHLETFFEVRVLVIRPGATQLFDATLENVVMASLSVCYHGQTRSQLGVRCCVGPGLEKNPRAPFP